MAAAFNLSGRMTVAVVEALQALIAPELCRDVVVHALRRSRQVVVPDDPQRAAQFVFGPLRQVIDERFGTEMGECVVEDLLPILELAQSGVRRVRSVGSAFDTAPRAVEPLERETEPPPEPARELPTAPPPGLGAGPTLVVVSASDQPHLALTHYLPPHVRVTRAPSAFELFAALDRPKGPVWILLDGRQPAVSAFELSAMLRRLPAQCRVLLLGHVRSEVEPLLDDPSWSHIEAWDWRDVAKELGFERSQ